MKMALSIVALLLLYLEAQTAESKRVVRCLGTNSKLSIAEDRMDHLKKMVTRYTNCTHVQGNLEITSLEDPNIDVSFLKDIEVVTGYVLIAMNYIPYLPLANLKVIRGQELYGPDNGPGNLALYVAVNFNRANPSLGLKELGFKSLTEIQRGNISIIQNSRMCFADKINWQDILNPLARRRDGWTVHIDNELYDENSCKECDPSCEHGYCWGEGQEKCQILTSTLCHSNCGLARCRGPGPDDCCDGECAGGCHGPTDRDCYYCLHVNNSNVCQANCPSQFKYDQQTSRYLPNPDFKYHYNDMCVDKCPNNMLVEENGCVKHCRKGRHNNGSGICVACNGNECNKECFGVGNPDGPLRNNETVDAKNVHFFEGCNIVRGNVIFMPYAFSGDNHTKTPPMTTEQVMKAFSAVKVINGYLKILSWPRELKDFSVFSNLSTIIGIDLFRGIVSFLIQDSIVETGPFQLSHVKSLGFHSLKTIKYGNVYIGFMKSLCYQDSINWTTIVKHPVEHSSFKPDGTLLRANLADCSNETCHPACSSDGCWGPGPHECLKCKKFSYNGQCKLKCNKEENIYQKGKECIPCDAQCLNTCDGPGPMNCTGCKNFRDGEMCVDVCPYTKYPDRDNVCLPCHENCIHQTSVHDGPLCSGPNKTLAPGGCEYCHTVVTDRNLDIRNCLPINQTTCPEAHFHSKYGGPLLKAHRACVPCFKNCNNCTGSAEKDCLHAIPGKGNTAIVLSVVITIICLGLIGCIFIIFNRRKENTRKKRQMSMRALGLEAEPEPMTPSGVAPNQAQLRIVKETELTIGKILGSGAFGTVHKGYWIPDLAPREKVRVPVAIKVLRDESSQVASNEILDEAFVMASCEHPNLVRLLGISLSQRIMLITQLMPLGNLLEYVRDNKDNIGSQNLLNWCLQIAKGMCYLAEEKHLVHRDLAARNVLVKSPNHVRITDFGLAKLLDVNEDVYRAEGGKMPIKWLALESIQHRIFTQKSDVWSFGVTVWELMTFGKKPYENVPAREVHTLLEKGERLLQPTTCTIDVYMMMIKCWTVEAEARPTFRELVDEFSRMARDPQRYLVIPNDGRLPELPSPTTSEFFRNLRFEEGDDFPIQDAEEYLHPFTDMEQPHSHFPLQPAPMTAQWRKQHEGQHLLNGRFGPLQSSSTADSRLDSAVTVMTSLPSESIYPNGCSTPFGAVTPGPTMTPRQRREVTGFSAFGRSSDRISRDHLPGPSAHGSIQSSRLDHRTQSESSDVFLNTPSFQRKDAPWESVHENPHGLEHPGMLRAREDSATLRYSAEPILFRQESRPNANGEHGRHITIVGGCEQDEDGYLAPTDTAKQKPEYLDPMAPSPSERRRNIQHLIESQHHPRSVTNSFSGMENPDYEPTFYPGGRSGSGYSSGLHNLIGARSSIPATDDDGYEVPMTPMQDGEQRPRKLSTEYENIDSNTGLPDIGEVGEEESGYLTANHHMLPRRHGSQSGDSTSSEKRDSGMQSEGDEDIPLKAKNVKATGGHGKNGAIEPSSGNHQAQFANALPGPSGPVSNMPNALPALNNTHSVDNPNYELLENMTDGGFQPMAEFKPDDDVFCPRPAPANNNSKLNPFPVSDEDMVFHHTMNSPGGSNPRKNPLKLTINCDGNGCDDTDDIFVTPETKRRVINGASVSGDDFDENLFITPESRRRNPANGKLTPDVDQLAGKVARTYSEPDSGVGIEMGVDNILYHRLGSSGWDGSE